MTFKGFFHREGTYPFFTYEKLTVNEFMKFLQNQKSQMINDYQEYLGYARYFYQEGWKKVQIKQSIEEQARTDERKAYQEELYYYIDPIVTDKENHTEKNSLNEVLDKYLNFDDGNLSELIFIKGKSGVGKPLILLFLEHRLLEKEEDGKMLQCRYIPF